MLTVVQMLRCSIYN